MKLGQLRPESLDWSCIDSCHTVYDLRWKRLEEYLFYVRVYLLQGTVIEGRVYTRHFKQLALLLKSNRNAPVSLKLLDVLRKGYYNGS